MFSIEAGISWVRGVVAIDHLVQPEGPEKGFGVKVVAIFRHLCVTLSPWSPWSPWSLLSGQWSPTVTLAYDDLDGGNLRNGRSSHKGSLRTGKTVI